MLLPSYFPPGGLSERPDLHRFRAAWFGAYLSRMEEPPLYPPAEQPTSYRCLCLPTWDRPSVVRLETHGPTWRLTGKHTNGNGGFEVGQVDHRTTRLLTWDEAARVADLLPYVRFWALPTFVVEDGLDGTTWVLEGVRRGRYHVVHRWEPEWGDSFGEFCTLLMRLSGVADCEG